MNLGVYKDVNTVLFYHLFCMFQIFHNKKLGEGERKPVSINRSSSQAVIVEVPKTTVLWDPSLQESSHLKRLETSALNQEAPLKCVQGPSMLKN